MKQEDEMFAKVVAWLRKHGLDRLLIDIKQDGRVEFDVYHYRDGFPGFAIPTRHADVLPGGPLPTPFEALHALLKEKP